jgi:hypothetical protein
MQIRSLNPADQARVRNNDATLEEVAPQTEELENFDGVTVRGSEDVDERARKLEAVKAGLGAVTGQGYVLPQTQVVLGELGSTSPSVATMVDPTTQDDGYNLFLSDQKFLAHSKMERNSDRGVRGGRRTAAYQDGPDARLPTGEVIREANGRAFKRNTPWGSGPRGVADQMGDRAHSKWRRSATNKRNKSEAMAKAIVVHEMGHVLHSQQSPEQFWQLKISGAAAPPDLAAKVSAYAGENALEFVAEVFTGRTLGIEYGSDVIAEYLKLGGPTVPKAQLQAPVDNLDALERAHAPVQVQGNQQGNQQGNPQGNPQNGGASTPNNFVTTALYGDNATGNIQHNFTWGAVSGRLEDLAGVATRERVRFDRDPALFMPAYNAYLLVDGRSTFQGTTLLKEGPAGNTGAGGDHHSAGYGAFFDAETGFTRAESMLTAVQWYEYKDAATNAWLPIPNAVFTIVRSMKREGGVLGMGKSYYLTTTKEGGGQSATARVKMHANQQSYNAAQRR